MNIETADRLIALRKRKGLSQEELAETLGISRQAVSKWERAESSPDMDNAIQLSRLYNVSLDELFGNKPEYEIELDSMEPDLPGEADAEEPEPIAEEAAEIVDAPYESIEELSASAPEYPAESLSSMISGMVHDAVSTANEAVRDAGRIVREAAGAQVCRELSIPAGAETIRDAVYEGIRSFVCSARANLRIVGTESDVCSVTCEGPAKEKERCWVYTEGSTLHIVTEDAKRRLFFGVSGRIGLNIEVVLPAAERIDVGLKGGDLTLDGVRAESADAKTGGGGIDVNGCVMGELGLKTGGGDIGIVSSNARKAEIVTGGGDIEANGLDASNLLSARTGGGDMSISGSAKCVETVTGGGDIELSVKAEGVKASSGGGDIDIRCSGAKFIGAKTGGGDIKTELVGCTGVTADLASAGGEASIDYKHDTRNVGRKLNITAGDGSTVLEMRSGGGDIEVVVK